MLYFGDNGKLHYLIPTSNLIHPPLNFLWEKFYYGRGCFLLLRLRVLEVSLYLFQWGGGEEGEAEGSQYNMMLQVYNTRIILSYIHIK